MATRRSERAESGRGGGRRRALCGGLVALVLGVAGCEESGTRTQKGPPSVRAEGVVARVNGEAIAGAEVRRLAELTGLTPREALDRLVSERLLAQHAEARGYGDLAVVHRELARARVRALLQEVVERGRGPDDIPLQKVHARFEHKRAALEAGGSTASFEEHEPRLRAELAEEARRHALDALLVELRARFPVSYDEDAIAKALSSEDTAPATGS